VVRFAEGMCNRGNLFIQSHCRANFLFACYESKQTEAGKSLTTSLMSPTTGAHAPKKRAFSRVKSMIRSPRTRCFASLRTMSASLRGRETELPRVYPSG
jgi:hypothetical protein